MDATSGQSVHELVHTIRRGRAILRSGSGGLVVADDTDVEQLRPGALVDHLCQRREMVIAVVDARDQQVSEIYLSVARGGVPVEDVEVSCERESLLKWDDLLPLVRERRVHRERDRHLWVLVHETFEIGSESDS